jgi:hypothetical protein
VLCAVDIAGTNAVLGVCYGSLASFIPEIFATRRRRGGVGETSCPPSTEDRRRDAWAIAVYRE